MQRQSATSIFQFSRNFQPSVFGEIELFIRAPSGGQLLPYEENEGLKVEYAIANSGGALLTVVLEIDGEILAESSYASTQQNLQSQLANHSTTLHGLQPGRHVLRTIVYDTREDVVLCEGRVHFELADWMNNEYLTAEVESSEGGAY